MSQPAADHASRGALRPAAAPMPAPRLQMPSGRMRYHVHGSRTLARASRVAPARGRAHHGSLRPARAPRQSAVSRCPAWRPGPFRAGSSCSAGSRGGPGTCRARRPRSAERQKDVQSWVFGTRLVPRHRAISAGPHPHHLPGVFFQVPDHGHDHITGMPARGGRVIVTAPAACMLGAPVPASWLGQMRGRSPADRLHDARQAARRRVCRAARMQAARTRASPACQRGGAAGMSYHDGGPATWIKW